jgi:hypothetical protein
MNKSTLIYVAIFLAGVMLADKVRTLPVINKLPSV